MVAITSISKFTKEISDRYILPEPLRTEILYLYRCMLELKRNSHVWKLFKPLIIEFKID